MAHATEPPRTREVETRDGRRLQVGVAGDGRRVVVLQVGSPSAGLLFDRWIEDAARRGLTLVAYDRPGYGGSARQPGRRVADCAEDVHAISAALGFERCAVWGFSGGGPHALACAALLDELVVAAATIGSMAPVDRPGFDYFAGRSSAQRQDYERFLSDRGAWEQDAETERDELLGLSLEEFRAQWASGSSSSDRAPLYGDFGAWLHHSVHAALAPGVDGWIDDWIALHSPWGFDLTQIQVPVKVWHGGEDQSVPLAHGRLLAETIPGAQSDFRPGDGHLTVAAERIGDVHEWLIAQSPE